VLLFYTNSEVYTKFGTVSTNQALKGIERRNSASLSVDRDAPSRYTGFAFLFFHKSIVTQSNEAANPFGLSASLLFSLRAFCNAPPFILLCFFVPHSLFQNPCMQCTIVSGSTKKSKGSKLLGL